MQHANCSKIRLVAIVAGALLGLAACQPSDTGPETADGSDRPQPAASAEQAEANIRSAMSGVGDISAVRPTEWPGVYEVVVNGQLLYASADGQHFIAGDLYQADGLVNLSDNARAQVNRQTLDDLAKSDSIVFTPDGEVKDAVWVFTDIDCPYCQRFHEHIDEYLARGIEVRYLAFPRAGKGSASWNLTESVWCADDRKAALTRAKSEQPLNNTEQCDNNAVAHGYAAGRAVGLRGTPMVLDADGRPLGGYMTPSELAKRLKSKG